MTHRRTATRIPVILAIGILAPVDNPLNERLNASSLDVSNFEKRPFPLSESGQPPPPATTFRQFAQGTHMVRGEDASTFLRLTRPCLIFSNTRKACHSQQAKSKWQGQVYLRPDSSAKRMFNKHAQDPPRLYSVSTHTLA